MEICPNKPHRVLSYFKSYKIRLHPTTNVWKKHVIDKCFVESEISSIIRTDIVTGDDTLGGIRGDHGRFE